jgi:hypothetical protein
VLLQSWRPPRERACSICRASLFNALILFAKRAAIGFALMPWITSPAMAVARAAAIFCARFLRR